MGRATSVAACERARTWAALRPDGELSTIELRLLGAHLESCSDCRRFDETVTSATRLVRETDDEAPACSFDARLVRRVRHRSLIASASRAGVAAAAILVAFAVGATLPDQIGDTEVRVARASVQALSVSAMSEPNDGEILRLERAGYRDVRHGTATRPYGVSL